MLDVVRFWLNLGIELRKAVDYLRYLEPEYRNAPKLRLRAELTEPVFLALPTARRLAASEGGRALFRRLLRWCERGVPADPAIVAFIRRARPDLVLVTPLVEPGSPQSEYVRAARALGIPTGLCVYSWDNLTSKGLIQDPLDIVTDLVDRSLLTADPSAAPTRYRMLESLRDYGEQRLDAAVDVVGAEQGEDHGQERRSHERGRARAGAVRLGREKSTNPGLEVVTEKRERALGHQGSGAAQTREPNQRAGGLRGVPRLARGLGIGAHLLCANEKVS